MKLFITLLITLACFSCKNTTADNVTDTNVDLPVDFEDFLERFHSDSIYQMEHIRFPLQGIPTMMDSLYDATGYTWSSEDWIMHRAFESNEEFEQNFSLFTDDMITERITHISGKMAMERRFAKMDDEWNLIYYAAMNFVK